MISSSDTPASPALEHRAPKPSSALAGSWVPHEYCERGKLERGPTEAEGQEGITWMRLCQTTVHLGLGQSQFPVETNPFSRPYPYVYSNILLQFPKSKKRQKEVKGIRIAPSQLEHVAFPKP